MRWPRTEPGRDYLTLRAGFGVKGKQDEQCACRDGANRESEDRVGGETHGKVGAGAWEAGEGFRVKSPCLTDIEKEPEKEAGLTAKKRVLQRTDFTGGSRRPGQPPKSQGFSSSEVEKKQGGWRRSWARNGVVEQQNQC